MLISHSSKHINIYIYLQQIRVVPVVLKTVDVVCSSKVQKKVDVPIQQEIDHLLAKLVDINEQMRAYLNTLRDSWAKLYLVEDYTLLDALGCVDPSEAFALLRDQVFPSLTAILTNPDDSLCTTVVAACSGPEVVGKSKSRCKGLILYASGVSRHVEWCFR